jgi:hypothetical protein
MNQFYKSISTGMILLAAAGCAGEDQSQSTPRSTSAAVPTAPPTAQVDAVRAKMSAETQAPGSTVAPPAKGEQKANGGPKVEGPKEESAQAAKTGGLTADQIAAIKELPASEQQVAMKQHSCPVSEEPLGSMGKPWKVSAEGRTFYLCCKNCEKDVKADPKSVLAKLDQKRP